MTIYLPIKPLLCRFYDALCCASATDLENQRFHAKDFVIKFTCLPTGGGWEVYTERLTFGDLETDTGKPPEEFLTHGGHVCQEGI